MFYSKSHLIASEIDNEILICETEVDKSGDVTGTMYIKGKKEGVQVQTLDYPSWCTIRASFDSQFQDFEVQKQVNA